MNVVKIINWLRSVELLAGNVYQTAADKFPTDQAFSSFLSRLSHDEEWHAYLLGEALQAVEEDKSIPKFNIKIDSVTKQGIENPFIELNDLILKKDIGKKELVDLIVKAEFSEWNSLFLYTIKLAAKATTDFQHIAATIESHKERILQFTEDLPEDIKPHESLSRLTNLWDKKILIMDEDKSFRELLSDLLRNMGEIEEASDGTDALEKIRSTFFNVIVSEVGTEKTNGIELYQKAVEINPHINRNFIFCADGLSSESKTFFLDNHLTYMEKPLSIRSFVQTVQDIITKTL